jgi:hypothetical protein
MHFPISSWQRLLLSRRSTYRDEISKMKACRQEFVLFYRGAS